MVYLRCAKYMVGHNSYTKAFKPVLIELINLTDTYMQCFTALEKNTYLIL